LFGLTAGLVFGLAAAFLRDSHPRMGEDPHPTLTRVPT
jgi:hypothetical protein